MIAVRLGARTVNHGRLAAVAAPLVRGSRLPAVQARLMLPLVVLAAHHKAVLVPDQLLAHRPSKLFHRLSEHIPRFARTPDVIRCALSQPLADSIKRAGQQLQQCLAVSAIIFDGHCIAGLADIIDAIRRVSKQ